MDTKKFLASELLINLSGGGYHWGRVLDTSIPGGFLFELEMPGEEGDNEITFIPFQHIKSLTLIKEKE